MKISLIKKLSNLASTLDRKGFYQEASYIDDIIRVAVDYNDVGSSTERPQTSTPDGAGTRSRTRSDFSDGDTGVKPRKPSSEAILITLKNRLMRIYGNKYNLVLTDEALRGILDKFGLIDINQDGGSTNYELGNYLEELKYGDKDLMSGLREKDRFPQRLKDGQCISCGDDTGSDYLERGEDIVSSPVCDSCMYKGLGENEELFLRERGLLGDLATMRETPTDPSVIEENYFKSNDYFKNNPDEIMPELLDKKRIKPRFQHPDDEVYND